MVAVRRALLDLARELNLPRARYPDPSNTQRQTSQPEPLELAALAITVRDALELIAAEHVERARELDGFTWEHVGERFGTSMQSAHSRFRRES
jgi:hypothetical protein